jgi:hypothetical protein
MEEIEADTLFRNVFGMRLQVLTEAKIAAFCDRIPYSLDMREFMVPLRCIRGNQASKYKRIHVIFLGHFENSTDTLSQNVGNNYSLTLPNIPECRGPQCRNS